MKHRIDLGIYAVIWDDATFCQIPEGPLQLSHALDVGFAIEVDSEKLTLGRELFGDGSVRDTIAIPGLNIVNAVKLGTLKLDEKFREYPHW